jgi:hypothetical protein
MLQMETLDFTISSTDHAHNNRIFTNITAPQTEYCKMTVTSLITAANFVVLGKHDYITINDVEYYIQEDFSDVNTASLTEYLNSIIKSITPQSDLEVYYDSCSRIYFTSLQDIVINNCSYNLKLMLGLINVDLPLSTTGMINLHKMILCPDVGFYLSTPVLYLSCNLGSSSYKNMTNKSFTSMRVLMRLTNSFFAKQPIVNVNGDYTTTIRCSDLSDVRFTLIDANYQEVNLLCPMYLTVQIEAIPDKDDSKYNVQDTIQTQVQMTNYAYMTDLTERGQDISLEEIDKYIYFKQPQQQQRLGPIGPTTD